jgi:hypothetical protein
MVVSKDISRFVGYLRIPLIYSYTLSTTPKAQSQTEKLLKIALHKLINEVPLLFNLVA